MQRELRLTGSKRFSLIHQEGRSWANRLLVLRAVPNDLDTSRFGFAVGKRVGNAVIRNKVRRRLRELVRAQAIRPGWDVILIARRDTSTVDYDQLKHGLELLLIRADLLKVPAGNQPTEAPHSESSPLVLESTRRTDSMGRFSLSNSLNEAAG